MKTSYQQKLERVAKTPTKADKSIYLVNRALHHIFALQDLSLDKNEYKKLEDLKSVITKFYFELLSLTNKQS